MPGPYHRICGPTDSDLAEYLRQLRAVPRLTPAEERDLTTRFKNQGCERARERLVCSNLRLVVYIAKRYAGLGVPMQDLCESGNLGLLQAVDRFDVDKGVRFSTFAFCWIRRSILHALAEQGCVIRIPEGQRRNARICREVAARLSETLGRTATVAEVARDAGLSQASVRMAEKAQNARRVVSSDDKQGAERPFHDRQAQSPPESLADRELRERLRVGLRSLPSREAELIRLRFGLGSSSGLSSRDIGRRLGMPTVRVDQLLGAALQRLEMLLGSTSAPRAVGRARTAAG